MFEAITSNDNSKPYCTESTEGDEENEAGLAQSRLRCGSGTYVANENQDPEAMLNTPGQSDIFYSDYFCTPKELLTSAKQSNDQLTFTSGCEEFKPYENADAIHSVPSDSDIWKNLV